MSEESPIIHIYTDGGADPNPGRGGWGAVLLHPTTGKVRELSGHEPKATNNRMELTAAIKALETLETGCRVKLFTDSQYLRKGITEWLPGWIQRGWKRKGGGEVLNADLWRLVSAQNQRHEIRWEWVKGHAGNTHNERADALATAALRGRQGAAVSAAPAQEGPPADIEVFLKVSASPSGGAWAAIVRQGEEEEIFSERVDGATANRLDILSAQQVLEGLPTQQSVAIHTGSDYLRNGATEWIHGWQRRGWKTGAGDPVKNAEDWRLLIRTLGRRKVSWPAIKGLKLPEMKRLEVELKGKMEPKG